MDIQSLYQRWHDANINVKRFVMFPDRLSYDSFVSDWLGDADILYNYGYNVAAMSATDFDSLDEFDAGIFSNEEAAFIFQTLLTSTPA